MALDEEQLEGLRAASALTATARLAGISYLEARKRAREAIARASEMGCTEASIAKACGVTRHRVQQVLEQEAMRAEMNEEDYDKLIMSFPPLGLTSQEHQEWSANQVHGEAVSRYRVKPRRLKSLADPDGGS